MSNYAGRLERLETQHSEAPQIRIGLPMFAADGELWGYRFDGDMVTRNAGEDRDQFMARVRLQQAGIIVLFGKGDEGVL